MWAEPSFVDACAWEYQETAAFLEAGEAVAGEYVWGRYDLLVLPPSFPYGGVRQGIHTAVDYFFRGVTVCIAHAHIDAWLSALLQEVGTARP